MVVHLTQDFIRDIQGEQDANFAKRVFRKIFDEDGSFRRDINDHRYHGLDDAWIRYVSQGGSAFRVIYLRKGADVYIYRAGPHSVEDNLKAPTQLEADIVAAEALDASATLDRSGGDSDLGRLLCSLRTPYLSQMVLGRRLIPHSEVVLISPFLSLSLLTRTARLGRMLDIMIEDGSAVTLLTRPPVMAEVPAFKDLEARGVALLFHQRLHAKLYMFFVDQKRVGHGRSYDDLIILGSANLTESGFSAERDAGNEELSYEVPSSERPHLESYLAHLALGADDLIKVNRALMRAQRTSK